MSIILFLITLAVLVLSHEFGHFFAAKKSGIRVDEFGFGFPPRLFKFKKGETLYSFNLIPFGGFVKIHGEEGEERNDLRSFSSKSISARVMVIVAGVFFNLLLAWLCYSSGYAIGAPVSADLNLRGAVIKNEKIIIVAVVENSPASVAGLSVGDEIIGFSETEEVQKFINNKKGQEISIFYRRGNKDYSVKMTPRENPPKNEGAVGIAMDKIGIVKLPVYWALWEGLKTTCQNTIAIAGMIFSFIYDAIRGIAGFNDVAGPVGIMKIAGAAAKMGLSSFFNFIAILSINLAVINILPLPALDGGRLFFLLIEKIKGSPINARISSITHGVGLALLLLLMALITYHDILRLI